MSVLSDFKETTIYFSKLIGAKILSENGTSLGRLTDVFVDYEDVYPLILAIQFKKNNQIFYVDWNHLNSFNYKKIIVKADSPIGRSRTFPKVKEKKVITSLLANQFSGDTVEYPPIGKVILDRQIVDTSGKKVVRVNDIEFIKTGKNLRVTHAAIGLRSMIRRLGYEPFVDSVIKSVRPNSKYLKNEKLINWKFVHAIPDRSVQSNVKLSLNNEDLKDIHPADLADILEELDTHARDQIFHNLDPQTAAETLSEVEQDLQASFLKSESPEEVAKIIEYMGTDEAADILSDLDKSKAGEIISNIEDNEIQEEIQELLEYDEDTAGGIMSTEVFEVHPEMTKNEVIESIPDVFEDVENVYDLYIIDDDGILLGTCSMNELLRQRENLEVKEIMESTDIKCLPPDLHWKKVASFMSKYNLINVPIVDETNTLLGMVSVDDILPWLLDER